MDEIHIVNIDHFQKLNDGLIAAPLEYTIIGSEKRTLKLGPQLERAEQQAIKNAEKSLPKKERKALYALRKELKTTQSELTTERDPKRLKELTEKKNRILERLQPIEQAIQAKVPHDHALNALEDDATFYNSLIHNMSPYLLRRDPNTNILSRIAQYDAYLKGRQAARTAARFGGVYGAISSTGVAAQGGAQGQPGGFAAAAA